MHRFRRSCKRKRGNAKEGEVRRAGKIERGEIRGRRGGRGREGSGGGGKGGDRGGGPPYVAVRTHFLPQQKGPLGEVDAALVSFPYHSHAY